MVRLKWCEIKWRTLKKKIIYSKSIRLKRQICEVQFRLYTSSTYSRVHTSQHMHTRKRRNIHTTNDITKVNKKQKSTMIAVAIPFHTLLSVCVESQQQKQHEGRFERLHRSQLLIHAKWFKHCLAVNAFGRRTAVGILCVLHFLFVSFFRIVVHQYYQAQWEPESERERGCATTVSLTKKFVYKFFFFVQLLFKVLVLCVCVRWFLCSCLSKMRWKCKWLHKIDC